MFQSYTHIYLLFSYLLSVGKS